MKKLLYYVIIGGILISMSTQGSEYEQNILQMCTVIKDELPRVNNDCVGPCDDKDNSNDQNKNIDDFFAKLEVDGIKKACTQKVRTRTRVKSSVQKKRLTKQDRVEQNKRTCRCEILQRHKDQLNKACNRDDLKIYLVKDIEDEQNKKLQKELRLRFHNRYEVTAAAFKLTGVDIPKCRKYVKQKFSVTERDTIFRGIKEASGRPENDLDDYLGKLFNNEQQYSSKSDSNNIKELVSEMATNNKFCKVLVDDLQETLLTVQDMANTSINNNHLLDVSFIRVDKCLNPDSVFNKMKREGNDKVISLSDPSAIEVLFTKLAGVEISAKVELYDPTGKKIKGENNTEILRNHRQSWITHSLERLIPYVTELEYERDEIRQELITETDPQRRQELLAELDDIEQARKETQKVIAETKSFEDIDPIEKTKVASQPKKSSPSRKAVTHSTSNEGIKKSQFNKGFNVKSAFDGGSWRNATTSVYPDHSNKKVTSKKAPKPKMASSKQVSRTPSSVKSSVGSRKSGRSKNRVASNPIGSSGYISTTPKYLFKDVERDDPKVVTMVSRLRNGELYAFVNSNKKSIAIFKNENYKQVFVAEKSVSELSEMGIDIDESKIELLAKITFKDKKIFFEYEDGSYQEENLRDVTSSKGLEALF